MNNAPSLSFHQQTNTPKPHTDTHTNRHTAHHTIQHSGRSRYARYSTSHPQFSMLTSARHDLSGRGLTQSRTAVLLIWCVCVCVWDFHPGLLSQHGPCDLQRDPRWPLENTTGKWKKRSCVFVCLQSEKKSQGSIGVCVCQCFCVSLLATMATKLKISLLYKTHNFSKVCLRPTVVSVRHKNCLVRFCKISWFRLK